MSTLTPEQLKEIRSGIVACSRCGRWAQTTGGKPALCILCKQMDYLLPTYIKLAGGKDHVIRLLIGETDKELTCWQCSEKFVSNQAGTSWVASAVEGEMVLAYVCPVCLAPAYGTKVIFDRE